MEIRVNGAQTSLLSLEGETLGGLFERLNAHFDSEKSSVVGMSLDGKPVDLAGQEGLWDSSCSSYSLLEIEVVPHAELSRRTLADLKELVTQCPGACIEAASNFQTGSPAEGLKRLDNIFQLWAVLFQSFSDAASFHQFRLADVKVGGKVLPELLSGLSDLIRRLQEAVKSRDYVTVADLLEYEMVEVVPGWIQALDAVLALVASRHEPA
ncbi:MAG: hypothetical protein AB7F75_00995 [Planctomycetota bacterium]